MISLNLLPKIKGKKHKSKRIGRGYGSGVGGHTTGRGTKGQKSRTGGKVRPGFAGGQNPLYKSLPRYRGLSPAKDITRAVNLGSLDAKYKSGEVVTLTSLKARGLVSSKASSAKILAAGEIKHKLTIKNLPASKTAIAKITKAGGKVI